jgi:choline dehydrogenase
VHAEAVEEYLTYQSGPLTGIGGGIFGFEKLPNRSQLSFSTRRALSSYPSDFPEFEYLGLSPGSNPLDAPLANNYVGVTVLLEPTFSKGSVTLRSDDPHVPPIVDINALSHPAEVDLLIGGMKRLRELAKNSGVLVREVSPGEGVKSDEELEEWIREHAGNGVHGACTSKCFLSLLSVRAGKVANAWRLCSRCYGEEGGPVCGRRYQRTGL